jgi:site-specific DNA recombinase
MMNAIYTRVSTDEQAREGVSLQEQQERLKAYCRAMGWTQELIVFTDDGYSAKSLDRPQLNKLIDHVKTGTITRIMVTKLDRMSRRLLDLLSLIELFQEHNVSFISISESFDTNTPSGRLTLQVLGAVAEFERERIRERVFENMLHAAGTGKWLTQSPYGYDLIEKELVINEQEAKVVREIYNFYLEKGMGFYSIAKSLNEEGIPSKNRVEWSIRSIKLILSNPAYKGTLVWNRVDSSKKKRTLKDEEEWVVMDQCLPVIIEPAIWGQAQKKLDQQQIAPRAKSSPHLLGGLIRCGNCGSGMSIGWSGSKNRRYRVYRCSANKNKGTCTSKQYRADNLEEWFKIGMLNLFSSVDKTFSPKLVEQKIKQQKNEIEQKLQTAKQRYKRKVEAYTAGLIDLEDLNEEKERLDKVLMESTKSQSDSSIIDIKELEKNIQKKITNVVDAIETLPIEEAKGFIGTLVKQITIIGDKNIEIEFHLL